MEEMDNKLIINVEPSNEENNRTILNTTFFSNKSLPRTNYFTMKNRTHLGFPAPPFMNFQLSEILIRNHQQKLIRSTSRLFQNLNKHLRKLQHRPERTRELKLQVETFIVDQKEELNKLAKAHIKAYYAELGASIRRSICFCFRSRLFPLETALAIIMKTLPDRASSDHVIKMFDKLQMALPRLLYLYNIDQTFSMEPLPEHGPQLQRTIQGIKQDLTIRVRGAPEELSEKTQLRVASIAVKTKSFRELSF